MWEEVYIFLMSEQAWANTNIFCLTHALVGDHISQPRLRLLNNGC